MTRMLFAAGFVMAGFVLAALVFSGPARPRPPVGVSSAVSPPPKWLEDPLAGQLPAEPAGELAPILEARRLMGEVLEDTLLDGPDPADQDEFERALEQLLAR